MPANLMTERLKGDATMLGFCSMYPAPGIIEGIGGGWDFVWIDGQHGEMDSRAAVAAVRAADLMGLATLLRVPTHDAGFLGVYADMDPSAIMVPMVNDAAQARAIVAALRFPPLGTRSFGGRRVIDRNGRDYHKNHEVLVVAQIETREAVEHVEAIANTPGVDGLFFGPDDMKVQMGIDVNTPPLEHPRLVEAMTRTANAARAAGKFAAGVAPGAGALEKMRAMGYRLLVGGGDIMFLRAAAAAKLQELRGAIKPATPGPSDKSGGGTY
ncbi:MAG: aldolase/citrate lyase family protein [Planctomycetota bacterium]|nr:aldolase/citrate lyase family protein [Planctomycetota bacterium]